jgi:hypothetical protein
LNRLDDSTIFREARVSAWLRRMPRSQALGASSFIARSNGSFLLIAQQPSTSGEQMFRDLIRVMNAGDGVALRRFVDERFVNEGQGGVPPEQRVERLGGLRAQFGELTVRSVDASKPSEVTGLVEAPRTETWRRMTLFLNDGQPARILRVGFAPASAPDAPTRRPSDAELVAQLKGYVERLASRDAFSGTVLLAKKGVPLYQAAFGEANKDFGVKNTIDTKFNLGSMNKMFTAVSVMQLVEAGKLSLDDTLGKFLPAGAMKPEVLSKVRVKHLLSHTSGLGSYFNDEWDRQSRALYRTVDDWMPLIRNDSLQFEPSPNPRATTGTPPPAPVQSRGGAIVRCGAIVTGRARWSSATSHSLTHVGSGLVSTHDVLGVGEIPSEQAATSRR